jgi:hypothetical protein
MKVKELIRKLMVIDPELDVLYITDNGMNGILTVDVNYDGKKKKDYVLLF